MMLIPIPLYGIVVGLVLELWIDTDDGNLANNIEKLVADIPSLTKLH